MEQENAVHQPRWLRYVKLFMKKNAVSSIMLNKILFYDFELAKNGEFKKKSRKYLKTITVN